MVAKQRAPLAGAGGRGPSLCAGPMLDQMERGPWSFWAHDGALGCMGREQGPYLPDDPLKGPESDV